MDDPSPKARAVLDVVDLIPAGSVMSYGDVAACAGLGSARYVGHVLARFGDEVPWHRVVMADGSFATHLAPEQSALLRSEATPLAPDGARVDMHRARLA
jgi:methylated-DNA-protein-cysteine methyltransferase related protein